MMSAAGELQVVKVIVPVCRIAYVSYQPCDGHRISCKVYVKIPYVAYTCVAT